MSNEAYGENLAAEIIGASKLPGRKNNMARFSKGEYRNHEYSIVPLAEIAGKFGIEQVAGSETPIYYSREGKRFLTEITPYTLASMNKAVVKISEEIKVTGIRNKSIKIDKTPVAFDGGQIQVVTYGGQSLVLKAEVITGRGEIRHLAIKIPKAIFLGQDLNYVPPPIEMVRRAAIIKFFKEGFMPEGDNRSVFSESPAWPEQEKYATINVPYYSTDQYSVEPWFDGQMPETEEHKECVDSYTRRITQLLSLISGINHDSSDYWLRRLFEGVLPDAYGGVMEHYAAGINNVRGKDLNWLIVDGRYICIDPFVLHYEHEPPKPISRIGDSYDQKPTIPYIRGKELKSM